MQLAHAAGSIDRGTASDFVPTTRTNLVLAAGVALAAAGVIAVNPVAPMLSLDAHQSEVQLANTTAENLANLQDLMAGNPNPIGTAFGELSSYYSQVTSDSFEQSMAGIQGIWSGMGPVVGLETILPQMIEHMQQGDFTSAYNLLNWDMLFNMNNVFQPLFDHTVRGTGEEVAGVFGIGADMTRVWANVQEVFGDFDFWKSAAKYVTEPWIGFQFALSDSMTDNGDHVAQDPFDALLNGYIPWAGEDGVASKPFWGLLTEQGTVSYFLDVFPSKIAEALTANLPVDDVVDPELGGALADPNLFDLDWLTGLFS